jgi:hypothetical protein
MEFAVVSTMLIVLMFGVIDFSRAIYLRQQLLNLTREAANLEARGSGVSAAEIMTNALNATLTSALPLALNSVTGMVIVTSITNNGSNGYFIGQQLSRGTLSGAASRIGTGVGHAATMPKTAGLILPPKHTLYVAEIFYKFTPITPVGHMAFRTALPTQFYDAAYFSGL